jgi:hypothetical protein
LTNFSQHLLLGILQDDHEENGAEDFVPHLERQVVRQQGQGEEIG